MVNFMANASLVKNSSYGDDFLIQGHSALSVLKLVDPISAK